MVHLLKVGVAQWTCTKFETCIDDKWKVKVPQWLYIYIIDRKFKLIASSSMPTIF